MCKLNILEKNLFKCVQFSGKITFILSFLCTYCILNTTESMYFNDWKTKVVNAKKKTEKDHSNE